MSAHDDDATAIDVTADQDAEVGGDEDAAPAEDPRLLALWRAGVARVPEVARRDAGATAPIVIGAADEDDDEGGGRARDAPPSWWSMPKVGAPR